MGILAECPMCHKKQATKNKVCKCGQDLDRAKRSQRVRFWIDYYLPGGKQKREYVGYSIEEARNAESKRKVQKREDRFFEITLDVNMTFNVLSKWYLNLNSVKGLSSYARYKSCISNFNGVLGDHKVSTIKPIELEDYQDTRESQGAAPATIDIELIIVGSMVRRAWDNDLVSDRPIKVFRKVKNKLKMGANARNRTLTMQEYRELLKKASEHIKHLLVAGFHTGMRTGELVNLRWSHIDHKGLMIRLPAEMTKEKRAKNVPINHHVKQLLENLPRHLHHDFVFTYGNKPIKRFDQGLKNSCDRAGIPFGQDVANGFIFRDLRTTFKTNLLRAGVDKVIRDMIVGHSIKGMDAYYLKPPEEDLHRAMDKYTTWFDEVFPASIDQGIDQANI